jgi:hypothetical protein
MLTLLVCIRTAWDDYFTGTPTIQQSTEYGTRQTPSDSNVYVLNCLFKSINSGSDGGALYCSVAYLLIESSSFFSCKTSSSHGGAIYVSNGGGGQCVLHKVCGYDCCSNRNWQFAHLQVKDGTSSKNYINYSSITRCVNANSNTYHTVGLYYGKICCQSVNVSMNKCYSRIVTCYPVSDSSSATCLISYSSFADNVAAGYTCFYFYRSGVKIEIKSCNILRNKQTGSPGTEGTIYSEGYTNIEDSCVLENNANYIFYQYNSYPFTLSNCTVDKITNNGYLTTQNTVTKSFILGLHHLTTQNCHSEYDAAGYLSPIIQTPSSSKKQIHCCTCGKYFIQLQLRDLVSLICVFILNFK